MKDGPELPLLNTEALSPRILRYALFRVRSPHHLEPLIVRVAPRDESRDDILVRLAIEAIECECELLGGGELTYRPHACNIVLLCGESPDIQPEPDRRLSASIIARALPGYHVSAL